MMKGGHVERKNKNTLIWKGGGEIIYLQDKNEGLVGKGGDGGGSRRVQWLTERIDRSEGLV